MTITACTPNISRVCHNNFCFEVELAITPTEKARGLMLRQFMDDSKGMLFVYDEEDTHSFWMKNMQFPLDIIWINANKDVVYISKETQPCKTKPCESIMPDVRAQYILEINAGLTDRLNIKVGDKLIFKE